MAANLHSADADSYGVQCFRSAGSVFGAGTGWLKRNGTICAFPTRDAAQAEADRLNREARSSLVSYTAERFRA